MKKCILFLLLAPCFCLSQIKTGSFSELETIAKENRKPVIVHIYTDWCSVCRIEFFNLNKDKELVEMINENFYYIHFNAETTKQKINFQGQEFHYVSNGNSGIHELVLALSKNKTKPVYPLWIILDKDQNLVYYHEGQLDRKKLKEKLLEIPVL
jgi:thiol-disulfide isomerase/thioredoxin